MTRTLLAALLALALGTPSAHATHAELEPASFALGFCGGWNAAAETARERYHDLKHHLRPIFDDHRRDATALLLRKLLRKSYAQMGVAPIACTVLPLESETVRPAPSGERL